MRRGRLLLGGAVALLAVLVAALWLVPGMLDWNRYRDGIAALASEQLGRPVHIGGAVSLQVLPQPILTAADITIDDLGTAATTGEVGLHARALRLRVALGSLLAGRIDARELTLQGADLHLPWPPPPGAMSRRPPSWLTGLQARVEDSRLQVGEVVFSGVDATVGTDAETGTLSVAGVGRAGTRGWQFTARLARPGRDGAAGLDISVDGQDRLRDTGGTFSGQLGSDGGLSGRVAGRGPDLSLLMPAPALPWRGDGRLTAKGGLAVADELALEIGGAPARGAVALRVQPQARLDVSITAGRLDLDAWLPALLGRNRGTLRSGIPTGIDLSAEAATLAGGTLRRLRGGVDLAPGGVLRLREVSAILPGDAQLALSGEVTTLPGAAAAAPATVEVALLAGAARFDGTVGLKAPDLRGTLHWLERVAPMTALPDGVLHAADLSAHVVADAGQLAVSELRGTVDGSSIAGTASVRDGARPELTAALTLDRLALDPWVPTPAALLSPQGAGAALAALLGIDGDLKLRVERADWAGLPLGTVIVEMQTEVSRVMLRRLELQPLGARVVVSGQLGGNGRLSEGRLEAVSGDMAALRPAFGPLLRPWIGPLLGPSLGRASEGVQPLLRGPGSLLVLAAGPSDALAMRVTLEMGDLRVEAQPTVSLLARRWAGPLTLHHPGAPRLLEQLGLGGAAAWLGDGSLSLLGQVTVSPGRVAIDGATVSAGGLRGSVQVWADGRRVAGRLAFETLPLPLIYPRSPDPLPLEWLRSWQAALRVEAQEVQVGLTPILQGASADLVLEDGKLRLDRAMARLGPGSVSGGINGSLVLDAVSDPPRLSVTGEGEGLVVTGPVFGGPLDLVAGQAGLSFDLSAAGHSPAALLATLGGRVVVRVHDGLVAGFDLAATGVALQEADARTALGRARAAMLGGNTSFATLEAPVLVERGVAGLEVQLEAPSGTAGLRGSLDLQGGGDNLQLVLRGPAPGMPSLGLRLAGSGEAVVRTPELAGLARWLAARPAP